MPTRITTVLIADGTIGRSDVNLSEVAVLNPSSEQEGWLNLDDQWPLRGGEEAAVGGFRLGAAGTPDGSIHLYRRDSLAYQGLAVGPLKADGSVAVKVSAYSGTGTITLGEEAVVLLDTTAGNKTINFPAASGCPGRIYRLVKTVAANKVLTNLSFAGTAVSLSALNEEIVAVSDGSAWRVVGLSGRVGDIKVWSGSASDIEWNWALCDGSGGRPDLRDRFVMGAGGNRSPGTTGGSESHNHTVNSHTHAISASGSLNSSADVGPNNSWVTFSYQSGGTSITVANDPHDHGVSFSDVNTGPASATTGTDYHIPPYYALCYVMRMA